ncbi:MAG: amino acid ABC transporter permease [Lachnospiraceae bacterium]|nr:amino acid ABC transporter permease [Lachnospiraceae bacterium]MDE7053029.1 amino acid ABC transporter permease [Lachnospiraceae bacterium]
MAENILRVLNEYSGLFIQGIGYTLLLAFIAVTCGTILGTFVALLKMSSNVVLSFIGTSYIELFRNTPLLLQLYIFMFLLPEIGINLSPFAAVSVGLVLNTTAYISEIIRSGIQSVDHGQTEAARSLGLSHVQTLRMVVLPQAMRNILPALANEFVTDIKETSLASTFFVGDLMTTYRTVNGATFLTLEPLFIAGVIYFVLSFTLSKLVAYLERRLRA